MHFEDENFLHLVKIFTLIADSYRLLATWSLRARPTPKGLRISVRVGAQADDRFVNKQLVDAMLQRRHALERGTHLRELSVARRRGSTVPVAGDTPFCRPGST